MSDLNVWQQVLAQLQIAIEPEDYRRWFAATACASDTGDQITIWVPSEAIRRHIELHFQELLGRALDAIGRDGTAFRFVVAGFGDEEDDDSEAE